MSTSTISLEQVVERISECISLARWDPNASIANHPLRYSLALDSEGNAFILADDFGVEIHQVNLPGIRGSRPRFVVTQQHGYNSGNPEAADVSVDESDPLSADRAAVLFTSACFERYLMRQAGL